VDKLTMENKARKEKAHRNNSRTPTKPKSKLISYCPECETSVGVTAGATKAVCKNGHEWQVV